MTEYRRANIPRATWFFPVNLAKPKGNRVLVSQIDELRGRFGSQGKASIPVGWAILPDHLRCIWTLPPADTDCSMRWNMLKGRFTRAIEKSERMGRPKYPRPC